MPNAHSGPNFVLRGAPAGLGMDYPINSGKAAEGAAFPANIVVGLEN